MKITLAYELLGHRPDETIEVSDTMGRRLVREGLARKADGSAPDEPSTRTTVLPERDNPTVGDIKSLAAERGVSVQEAKKQVAAERRGETSDGKDAK